MNEKEIESREKEPAFKVERYSDEHKEQVIELINDIINNEFGVRSKSGRPDIKNIPEHYQRTESEDFWIALDEGNHVVGTIGLSDYGEGDGILERFNVKSNLRGKGIGSNLYSQLMDFAKACEYKKLFLGTSEKRKQAMDFYKKRGFSLVPKEQIPEDVFKRVGKDPLQMMLDLEE